MQILDHTHLYTHPTCPPSLSVALSTHKNVHPPSHTHAYTYSHIHTHTHTQTHTYLYTLTRTQVMANIEYQIYNRQQNRLATLLITHDGGNYVETNLNIESGWHGLSLAVVETREGEGGDGIFCENPRDIFEEEEILFEIEIRFQVFAESIKKVVPFLERGLCVISGWRFHCFGSWSVSVITHAWMCMYIYVHV